MRGAVPASSHCHACSQNKTSSRGGYISKPSRCSYKQKRHKGSKSKSLPQQWPQLRGAGTQLRQAAAACQQRQHDMAWPRIGLTIPVPICLGFTARLDSEKALFWFSPEPHRRCIAAQLAAHSRHQIIYFWKPIKFFLKFNIPFCAEWLTLLKN